MIAHEQREKQVEHLSISLLRDFVLCRYRLHWHLVDVKSQEKSTLLLGKIIHSIIQLAYYQVPMQEAYQMIWQELVGPYLEELEQWYHLDQAFRVVKERASKARRSKKGTPEEELFERDLLKIWQADHPEYAELRDLLLDYQTDFFPEMYWAKDRSLLDCYRWSHVLLTTPLEEILLPDALYVEGQSLVEERKRMGSSPHEIIEAHKQGKGPGYRLLRGSLPGVYRPIVGVPDVITDTIILDYKVTNYPLDPFDLAMDGQLMLYAHLKSQGKISGSDLPKQVGHRYITSKGIKTTLVPLTLFDEVIDQLTRSFIELEQYLDHPDLLIPVRGIPSPSIAPCKWCDWKRICVLDHNPFAGVMLDDLF